MSESLTRIFAAWGETDKASRSTMVDGTIGKTFFYADPNTPNPITSQDEYLVYISKFTQFMPGGGATVVHVSEHNGYARATVDFTKDGKPMQRGQYFAELDDDGRITRLVGFPGMGEPE